MLKRACRRAKLRILTGCIGLVGALVAGCGPQVGPPRPDDLLTPTELVPVLADLQIAEARAQRSARTPDTIQAFYLRAEKAIFWQRNVDKARFDASYAYYAAHPNELEAIYGALVDTLSMREVRWKARAKK